MSDEVKGNYTLGGAKMEETKKWCPFEKGWCGVEEIAKCALAIEMHQMRLGVRVDYKQCIFQAVVIILSEINQKTENKQAIQIPRLRGN